MRTGTDATVVRIGCERCSTIHASRATWCDARTNCWCAISASDGGPWPSGVGVVWPSGGVWVKARCSSSGDTGTPAGKGSGGTRSWESAPGALGREEPWGLLDRFVGAGFAPNSFFVRFARFVVWGARALISTTKLTKRHEETRVVPGRA